MEPADRQNEEDLLAEDRIAWILGSSRSGSTWLLRMLSGLRDAVPIDDPHLGHHVGVWRPISLAWGTSDDAPALTTLMQLKRHKPGYFFADRYAHAWKPKLRELILARFSAQAAEAATGDPLVIVKEPGSQGADLLLALFPNSRMVFLLRDGRDVVDSWLAAYQDGSWAQSEGAYPVAERGREAFIRWQSSVWAYRAEAVYHAYAEHDPARRVLVRYEELLADRVRALDEICAVLGVTPEREEIERMAREHDFERVPSSQRGEHEAVRAASPGGWRESMSAEERRAMHQVMGETLLRFGYIEREELDAELRPGALA